MLMAPDPTHTQDEDVKPWFGRLMLSSGKILDKLCFFPSPGAAAQQWPFCLPQKSTFRFNQFVTPADIPLHAFEGPAFEVSVEQDNALQWFKDVLLDAKDDCLAAESGSDGVAQLKISNARYENEGSLSNLGILATIERDIDYSQNNEFHWATYHNRPGPTQLLFYAEEKFDHQNSQDLGDAALEWLKLTTPPESATYGTDVNAIDKLADTPEQEPVDGADDVPLKIGLFAIQLSFDTIDEAASYQLPTPPESDGNFTMIVINPNEHAPMSHAQDVAIPSVEIEPRVGQKRGRLTQLFDSANEERRKTSRRSGSTVSAAAAKTQADVTSAPRWPPSASSRPGSRAVDSRDQTHAEAPTRTNSEQRPARRVPISSHTRRPSLLTTVTSCHESQAGSPNIATPTTTFAEMSIEAKNKQAISRTVLAGMRMFGLTQRTKSQKRHTNTETPVEINETDKADVEFKAVYHQAYKGVMFAFRHDMEKELVRIDSIRGIADRLLSVFCCRPP